MLPHTIPPGSWMIFSIFSSVGSRPSAAIRLILSQQALMPAHTSPRQCPPLHANKTILSYLHAGFGLELKLKKSAPDLSTFAATRLIRNGSQCLAASAVSSTSLQNQCRSYYKQGLLVKSRTARHCQGGKECRCQQSHFLIGFSCGMGMVWKSDMCIQYTVYMYIHVIFNLSTAC